MLKRWWISVGSFTLVCLTAPILGCSGGGAVESDASQSTATVDLRSDASKKKGPKLTPQQSNTTNGLIGISPVDKKVVWASGRNGTFLRTTDGGKHWTSGTVAGAEALQFRDVQGVSDKVAYLLSIGVGSDSRIYKTTNGGNSWTLQFQGTDPAFYDCFAFWSPTQGITMADSSPVASRIRGRALSFSCFLMKTPARNAYSTTTPAASVGVKTPPRMPPMMMMGISSAGNASQAPTTTWLNDARGSQG